jgi:hypothetical protein
MPAPRGERVASRYVVNAELASGGMGVVYRVFDRSTGEERALKRLNAEAASQKFLVEAFEREYQVLAGLDHPRIIRVFDYGVDELGPYYTMELLEGQDMRRAAPLPYREACRYLRDVATSLALLHARRLLHRDLSPGNVRITPDGHCKLLDFGALAAFGNSRLVVGTPPAIPPEALEGAPLDQRADLYALGALAFWMLTERHAYPARQIDELYELWKGEPPSPSALVEGIPKELDALVLSLLSADPLARPASAAEVIARLNIVGELAPEESGEVERLAESFLLSPRFIGRAAKLEELKERTDAAIRGHGAALRIEAIAGMGRTRLLEEIGVRAQVAGAGVLRVDASMYRDSRATARALAVRLLDALPLLSRECAKRYRAELAELGREVEARLATGSSVPPPSQYDEVVEPAGGGGTLDGWFADVSRSKPLVIEVDNVDDADDASLGLLVALAKVAPQVPLLLVVTERVRRDPRTAAGLVTLRGQCERISLAGLSPAETLELSRSIFGDAPNVERFAEWIHGRTAGSPLHCVEISRQLVARRVVRYMGGLWVLPVDRPDSELPAALEDALSIRLASLSEQARGLAECLSLQREQPTLELCRLLFEGGDDRLVLHVLDELARSDVLYTDQDGYRFSSMALREALLRDMDDIRLEENHHRLGEAFAHLAESNNHALRIEAGWHLIKGGDALRGADMIAEVTHNSATVRKLIANLHHAGGPIEAALQVYKRHRRSTYERMPLLAALAHAGYYEDRKWGEQYGDEALDACEDLSGVRTARHLRRLCGRWLGMMFGLLVAFLRFHLTAKRERNYPFDEMLVQLFGAVTTLTGTASLSLDVERATRVTEVLELFSMLPKRLAPVGIYQFCLGLREIGRERQTLAYDSFETLRRRFENPRYYPGLPADARILYITGTHFARGAFAVMREDGRAALDSANALEASGLKMYTMVASQLRFLYYANRGEFTKAAVHREQVELHAAHVGSAWQVETWEPACLIPVYARIGDIVALTRVADRLELLSKSVPSLRLYSRLARLSLLLVQGDALAASGTPARTELAARAPRSYIGWASTQGFLARGFNERGSYAEAKAVCESTLSHITDADREYVALFLDVDIQMAIAQAGLGEIEPGLTRIDGLLDRFRGSDHPLVQGCLHEARARIAWMAGRVDEYRHSLALVDHWFRPTGTPALIAKYERLVDLQGGQSSPRPVQPAPDSAPLSDVVTGLDSGPVEPANVPEAQTVALLSRRRETA